MRKTIGSVVVMFLISVSMSAPGIAALPPFTGTECSDVTVADFQQIRTHLETARGYAESNVAALRAAGVTTGLDVAETNLALITVARNTVQAYIDQWPSNPRAVQQSDDTLRSIMDNLAAATVKASFSAARFSATHPATSHDHAYQSFEHAALALDLAADIKVMARRCYMSAYLPLP